MAITSLHSGASGLSALNTKLDVIANNLANLQTAGFKSSRVNFQDLLYMEKKQPGVENASGDRTPIGLYVGLGVQASGTQLNFEQGTNISTGREFDLYIEGEGFFQVEHDDGFAYTRNGQFTRNQDGDLVLANDPGRRLEPAINIPDDAISVSISTDGQVQVKVPGQNELADVGNITLWSFTNPAGLEQIGETLFKPTGASGGGTEGVPGTDEFGIIRQGSFEGSNVDPTTELIELIQTQRAYEMNSQSIRAADEALQVISQLRR